MCAQWSLGYAKELCNCLYNLGPIAEVSFRSKQCPGQYVPLTQALAHQSCQAGASAPKNSLHHHGTSHTMLDTSASLCRCNPEHHVDCR